MGVYKRVDLQHWDMLMQSMQQEYRHDPGTTQVNDEYIQYPGPETHELTRGRE